MKETNTMAKQHLYEGWITIPHETTLIRSESSGALEFPKEGA